jgi:hypothetical protein
MFIILPTFWVVALGWAGVQTGTILNGLTKGTDAVGKAGSEGGQMAQKAVKSIGGQ